MKVIPDYATADRIGSEKCGAEACAYASYTVFQYPQMRTNLTLFGVEIVTIDPNGNRQVETIVTQ